MVIEQFGSSDIIFGGIFYNLFTIIRLKFYNLHTKEKLVRKVPDTLIYFYLLFLVLVL